MMYNDDDLSDAVEQGIFTQASVDAFQAFVGERRLSASVDEENFRLVHSFNDIFVVIACALVLFPAFYIVGLVSEVLASFVFTGLSWLLAEHFVLRRKMAFPGIFLAATFVFGAAITVRDIFSTVTDISTFFTMLAGVVAAVVHWWRFKVPITVASGIATGVFFVGVGVLQSYPTSEKPLMIAGVIAGILTFLFAMYWDRQDLKRVTYRADVAFWLHLLSAVLIIHPTFWLLGIIDGQQQWEQAPLVLGLYVCIMLVSLVIDRRSLIVSALMYVLVFVSRLVTELGGVSEGFQITGMVMGALLLVLAIFWQSIRGGLVSCLPQALQRHVPPVS